MAPESALSKGFLNLLAGMSISLLVIMLLSFPVGAYAVLAGQTALAGGLQAKETPFVFVSGIVLPIPVELPLGGMFFSAWAIYLCLFLLYLRRPSSALVARATMAPGIKEMFDNTLLRLPLIFSALYVLVNAIEALENFLGFPSGMLKGDPLSVFVGITVAPLREEIGFRVTMIGFVAILLGKVKGGRLAYLRALWHPARNTSLSSGERRYFVYFASIVSGVIFGIAHLAGGGWEAGKVIPASLAGIALGLAYWNYGLQLTVLIHWSFNYLEGTFTFMKEVGGSSILPQIVSLQISALGLLTILALLLKVVRRGSPAPTSGPQ